MNKIEIEIPNNKEIDWEASAKQKQIVFKNKQLTYEDVCKELFAKGHFFIETDSEIRFLNFVALDDNAATSKHQLECILAKNKLANTAVYLNNGWKPNLRQDYGCCLAIDCYDRLIIEGCALLCTHSAGKIMFKSEELARQAIEILGEETVKLALTPLY